MKPAAAFLLYLSLKPPQSHNCGFLKLSFFPVNSVSYALVSFKIFSFSDQVFCPQSVQTFVIKIFPFSHLPDHVPLSKISMLTYFPHKIPAYLFISSGYLCSLLLESLFISSAGNACGWEAGGVVINFLLQLPSLKGCSKSKTCARSNYSHLSHFSFRKCLEVFTKHSPNAFRRKAGHNFSAGMPVWAPGFPASPCSPGSLYGVCQPRSHLVPHLDAIEVVTASFSTSRSFSWVYMAR